MCTLFLKNVVSYACSNLILKNFGFQFVNNYFILFYIGYMKQIDTRPIGGPDPAITQCKGGTCLGEVQVQVAAIFTSKLLISQLTEIFAPRIKAISHRAKGALGIHSLENAAREARDTAARVLLPEETKELLNQDEDHLAHEKKRRERELERDARMAAAAAGNLDISKLGQVEAESYLLDYSSTFDDFNEMAIQFGYLALFSPVYPLACFFALLNNIVEMRVDASKVCYVSRRPTWRSEDNIGSWFGVMSLIGFVAVVTNVTMVIFVGKLFAATDEEAEGGFAVRIKSWHLWGLCVGIEHALLMLRVFIMQGLPNTPSWMDDVLRQLDWYDDNMKPGVQIKAEQEQKLIFDERYGVGEDMSKPQSKADRKAAAKGEASLTIGNIFIKLSKNGFVPDEDVLPDLPELEYVKMTNPIAFDDTELDAAESKNTGRGEAAASSADGDANAVPEVRNSCSWPSI